MKAKRNLKKEMLNYFKKNPGKDILDAARSMEISLGESANTAMALMRDGKLLDHRLIRKRKK